MYPSHDENLHVQRLPSAYVRRTVGVRTWSFQSRKSKHFAYTIQLGTSQLVYQKKLVTFDGILSSIIELVKLDCC